MIRVRIVTDEARWCHFNRANILREYAPDDMAVEVVPFPKRYEGDAPDLLCDYNYGHCEEVRQVVPHLKGWEQTILLVAFNRGWTDNPNYDRREYFYRARENAHAVLCNNVEFWKKAGELIGTYSISNGVDRRIFKPTVPMAERPAKVLWCGSEYHRETKNYDALLLPLKERLEAGGIACDFRLTDPYGDGVLSQQEMADWYNSGSVYVCASNTEGTPNTALEAAACGCAIVTTSVGNMPELIQHGVSGFFCGPTLDSLERSIRLALIHRERWSAAMLEDIAGWDWKERAETFYALFRGLHDGTYPLLRERGTR